MLQHTASDNYFEQVVNAARSAQRVKEQESQDARQARHQEFMAEMAHIMRQEDKGDLFAER